MRIAVKGVLVLVVCAFAGARAIAGPVITLTFEGLQNFEGVSDYYNGGLGSLGTGPGPDYGVTFAANATAYIPGLQTGTVTPFPGDPSPPTVLLLAILGNGYTAGYPTSTTMDVTSGFVGALTFYYINIAPSVRSTYVDIYSGLDGTGTLLAEQSLATTPEAFGGPTVVSFSGTASSVVFGGGNDQLALDNISFFAQVPEPPSWISLAAGLGSACLILSLRRQVAGARTGRREKM
jgi:hypothetical protein